MIYTLVPVGTGNFAERFELVGHRPNTVFVEGQHRDLAFQMVHGVPLKTSSSNGYTVVRQNPDAARRFAGKAFGKTIECYETRNHHVQGRTSLYGLLCSQPGRQALRQAASRTYL